MLWHVQNVAPAAAAARFRSALITAALRSIWKVMARKSEKTRGEKLAENAAQQGRATCLAWPGETFSANISTDHRRSPSIVVRRSPTVTSCQLKNHDRTKCTKPRGEGWWWGDNSIDSARDSTRSSLALSRSLQTGSGSVLTAAR